MSVHLINPSNLTFGTAVITPRWLFVLAAATPREFGDPVITDETLSQIDPDRIRSGDIVGIGIHTANALRGYEIGRMARERGALVVFGGIHATLCPEEAHGLGGAHAVVTGDGDLIWARILSDCSHGCLQPYYDGGRVDGSALLPARWDLLPKDRYMWGSVQTVRGCPKSCSFCSVWRVDGHSPRNREVKAVIREIIELRRVGFRIITLADDNFYPVTLNDMALADRRNDSARCEKLKKLRTERFELMAQLARLPKDIVFFTQITMEAAEDAAFLKAMREANIKAVLVGIESITPEGLKAVHKQFNLAGEALVHRMQEFRNHGIRVLGSFIFGLSSDRPETFEETARLAQQADITFAQFLPMTLYPGTVDFSRWEKAVSKDTTRIAGVPITKYWLIPETLRPKLYFQHPLMTAKEIRERIQALWDHFYSLPLIWQRARHLHSLRDRVAFVLMSKLFRQMFANTGIATDSGRVNTATRWARWIAKPCRWLFSAPPIPDLQMPEMLE